MNSCNTRHPTGGAPFAAGPGEHRALATRSRLIAASGMTMMAKAVIVTVVAATLNQGWGGSLAGGLGLSWAFWVAGGLFARQAWLADPTPAPHREVVALATSCFAAILLPALTGVCLATILGVSAWLTSDEQTGVRGAGMTLLAMTGYLFWGPLLTWIVGPNVAAIDATVVGAVVHSSVHDNVVRFPTERHWLIIDIACTSIQNLSTALMLFVAIVRSFRATPKVSELAYLAAVFAIVVFVNDTRLVLMVRSLADYHWVHGENGRTIVNLAITFCGLLAAAICVRREAFG